MSVSFNQIPSGNGVRVPLFYAEMDDSQANTAAGGTLKSLLIGQKIASGTATYNSPMLVSSKGQATALFGRGSMLERMYEFYRLSDPTGEVWCMVVEDAPGATVATGTITVSGTATAAGVINEYIGAQKISVAVAAGATAATVAAALDAAINNVSGPAASLPVTSSVGGSVVTLTCKWDGYTGNDITIKDSHFGEAGGERLPPGISLFHSGFGYLSGGLLNPVMAGAPIAALGDDQYDFIIHPYSGTGILDILQTEMGDSSGRWSWSRQVYGHCYTALHGSLVTLVAAINPRNDPHHTVVGMEMDSPHPGWEYAAAYGARNAVFISADPARPTQTGELTGIIPPRAGRGFVFSERNALLGAGVATSFVSNGKVHIERAVTTYKRNVFSQADTSYMDSETLHTAAYILRYLKNAITSKYARHKLASDGTRFGAGQAIVTPLVIRGELIGAYTALEELGIVENTEAFIEHLIVERDTLNPNRINVLFPPDFVNQLRVFSLVSQFRLDY